MLIADTSAWIEYLRRTESPADLALDAAVARDEVVIPELVKTELLAGARSNAEVRALEMMLEHFETQLLAPRDDFDHAVKLYLRCRATGYTPRGLVDCAITVMAMRAGLPVLHHDRDFAAIARVAGVVQAPGSLAT